MARNQIAELRVGIRKTCPTFDSSVTTFPENLHRVGPSNCDFSEVLLPKEEIFTRNRQNKQRNRIPQGITVCLLV